MTYAPLQEALRAYVKAADRLHQIEAQVLGNVLSDFHLSPDWDQQAKRLLHARGEVAIAVSELNLAVHRHERQTDANAETQEHPLPAEA